MKPCDPQYLILPLFLSFSLVVAYDCNFPTSSLKYIPLGSMSSQRRNGSMRTVTLNAKSNKLQTVNEGNAPNCMKSNLLEDWIHHDNKHFHYFSSEEAAEIRETLLTWYGSNRRKLPWRGDPPPYDGSTAGIATKTKRASGNKKKQDSNQASITNYFGTSTKPRRTSRVSRQLANTVENDKKKACGGSVEQLPSREAIPVSAYGVWVSEIMLQQTRVEAVIPYCE